MEWGVAFAFVGVYQLAFDPLDYGGTMDPWLEATGVREGAFFFLGVLALMSGFFAAGVIDFRTYHIPMWITTALALSMPLFLLAQGLVEARPIGGRLLPVPLPGWVGVGSAAPAPSWCRRRSSRIASRPNPCAAPAPRR